MGILNHFFGDQELITIGIWLEERGYFKDHPLLKIGWTISATSLIVCQLVFISHIMSENIPDSMLPD